MANTLKISVSLPAELVENLDFLSSRMGVSRSAIISEALSESMADAARLVRLIPPNPTPADVLRMRGESEELVRDRLASVNSMLSGDLFAPQPDEPAHPFVKKPTKRPKPLTPAQLAKEERKAAEAASMGLLKGNDGE